MPRIDPSNLNTALCPNCHKSISAAAAFCKYCGAKTGFSANKPAAAAEKAQQAVQDAVPVSEKPSIARVHPVEDDIVAGASKPAATRSPKPAAASPFETAPKTESAQTESPFSPVRKPRRQAVPSAAPSAATGKTQSAFSAASGRKADSTETAVPRRRTAALISETEAFASAGSAAPAPFKSAGAASAVRPDRKPQADEEEEFTDAFALGLPSWSLEPPNMPVNRRRK